MAGVPNGACGSLKCEELGNILCPKRISLLKYSAAGLMSLVIVLYLAYVTLLVDIFHIIRVRQKRARQQQSTPSMQPPTQQRMLIKFIDITDPDNASSAHSVGQWSAANTVTKTRTRT